jgi:hypothetical protein
MRPTEAEKRPRRRAQDVPFPSRARSAPPEQGMSNHPVKKARVRSKM